MNTSLSDAKKQLPSFTKQDSRGQNATQSPIGK